MKINLINMIINSAGPRAFKDIVIDDQGMPLSAPDGLHVMIMEYAKIACGGESGLVTASNQVTQAARDLVQPQNGQEGRSALVLAPTVASDDQLRAMLQCQYPGFYKDGLRCASDGPQTSAVNEERIAMAKRQYQAAIEVGRTSKSPSPEQAP